MTNTTPSRDAQYDLVILGSGSAAFAAAIKASALGARVVMAESGTIGGTCVNVGCIPSKTLIHAANLFSTRRHTAFEGLEAGNGRVDLGRLIRQKDRLVETLRQKKYIEVAEGNERMAILRGRARFLSTTQLKVGDEIVSAPRSLIATGARPCIPSIPGLDTVPYFTSTEAFTLERVPASLAIIGGGYIALELGQMFHRFGTTVTILERGRHVLRGFDDEIAEKIQEVLIEEGLRIHTHAEVARVAKTGDRVALAVTVSGAPIAITAEQLLIACGRVPNSEGLGLEGVGIGTDDCWCVRVNDEMRTSVEHIGAAGDVTGPPFATPVAAKQGAIAAENLLTGSHLTIDSTAIPRAVFTDPEVAAVGLTAAEARAKGMDVEADCLDLRHLPKAAAIYRTNGLVKMVVEKESRRIVGVQMVCDRAADLIHEAMLVVKFRLTLNDLIETIHVYPTMSEAIRMAAQMFTTDVSKLSCCAE